MRRGFENTLGQLVGWMSCHLMPDGATHRLVHYLSDRFPSYTANALGPHLSWKPDLDTMPEDLPFERPFQFEQLAGLFSSTSLDHAVISMTVRQAAYIFGLIRSMQAKRIIEVGRYKGGCTLLMAMAMNGEGQLWSIDLGEKEARLARDKPRSYDAMLADRCARLGLENVCLLVGDSRTINFETGAVDLVVIDGDHRYETVKSDFNRFATRLRKGGALLLDDVYPDGFFTRGNTDSKRFTEEVERGGDFRFVKAVNRMAHFERLGSNLVPS